jgi:hypothetical protein
MHGRAAEMATHAAGGVRGGTLDDVLAALSPLWASLSRAPLMAPGVLAELPAVSPDA